ncbi:methyl-accepting chemotaxis protein [Peptococcaceae bacterium]|nr:methyl-accepting chemotaxis protein [Peptococcaceae bacterium]
MGLTKIKNISNSIKAKLMVGIILMAVIPVLSISVILYSQSTAKLNVYQHKVSEQGILAVDATINTAKGDIVNIAHTFAPQIATLIETQDYTELRKTLQIVDGIDDPDTGTGKGLGLEIVIATDNFGNVLARSDVATTGDQLSTQDFGNALINGLNGKRDVRKIIFDRNFAAREGYDLEENHLMALVATQPVFNEQQTQVGLLILTTNINNNLDALAAIKALNDTAFTVYTPDGEAIVSYFKNPPQVTLEIIALAREFAAQHDQSAQGVIYNIPEIKLTARDEFGGGESTYQYFFVAELDNDGKLVAIRGLAKDITFINQLLSSQRTTATWLTTTTLIIVSIIAIILVKSFIKPINYLKETADKLAEGRFNTKVNVTSNDEIGKLAMAFENMRQKIQEIMFESNNASNSVQDFSQKLRVQMKQTADAAANNASTVSEVSATVDTMADNVNTVAGKAASTQQQADQGKIELQKVDTIMSEINTVTSKTADSVNNLNESMAKINEFVETITSIADQTKLLSLNAAIEAARAGEHGKGFMVVAEEVGKLSANSSIASKEIKKLVTEISQQSVETINAINLNKDKVSDGNKIITEVRNVFNDIIAQVDTLTDDINRVAQAANETSQAVQNIAASTEEQTASIEEVLASVEQLQNVVNSLNDILAKYK